MKLSSLHSNIKLRIIIIFFNTLTTNMIFPFMSIYFAKNLGLKITSIILTLAIVLSLIGNLYGGSYADKYGRKSIMVYSEGFKLIIFVGLLISNSPSYHLPIVTAILFILRNFFNGLYGPASEAMLLDITKSTERKYMYTIFYWITNLSIAIGSGIGAYFFDANLFLLFTILLIASFISFFITIYGIKETYVPDQSSLDSKVNSKGYIKNYIIVFKDRIFITYILSSMLIYSLEGHLTRYLAIKLQEQDFSIISMELTGTQLLGTLLIEGTICVILLLPLSTKLSKKFRSEKEAFSIGLLLYIVGFGMIATSLNPWILFIMMLILTIGEVMFVPILQSYMGDLTVPSLRSSYIAVSKLANRGSVLIPTGTVFLVSISSPLMFTLLVWVTGILGVVLLILFLPQIYVRRELENQDLKLHG